MTISQTVKFEKIEILDILSNLRKTAGATILHFKDGAAKP
jgi:hypothetical protein